MTSRSRQENLRFVRFPDPNVAMGLAVRLMLGKPAYNHLNFVECASILNGQILREHYGFVMRPVADGPDVVCGFVGWALTTEQNAEAWATREVPLSYADCLAGDAVIFNVWIADSKEINVFILNEVRGLFSDKVIAYWRRTYSDGSKRLMKVAGNQFVPSHVARNKVTSEATKK